VCGMVWIVALLCLGVVGVTGYYRGPVRAGFSFVGLAMGVLLANPLSPLTRHLLPLIGLHHPVWGIFVPQCIAFLIVLITFKIAGEVVNEKISVHFKYKADDRKLLDWQRLYSRLGLCVGVLNGAVYFLLLMIPVYAGGYFTTEAAGDTAPPGAQLLTSMRSQLGGLKMDRVLAAYDPTPRQVYQAADIVALVLHNPLLESRLAHYPLFLQLGEQREFQDLAADVNLQQLVAEGNTIEVVRYPKVQALLTNAAFTSEITGLIGNDLDDLQQYLATGQSPKYDGNPFLGVWTINPAATLVQERQRHPALTPLQLKQLKDEMFPIVAGLSLTALPNGKVILKKLNSTTADNTVVATGSWKRDEGSFQVNLPGSRPETSIIKITEANKLELPKDSYVMVFDKEM